MCLFQHSSFLTEKTEDTLKQIGTSLFTGCQVGSHSRYVQPYPIYACLCRQVECLSVVVAPGHVVRMLRSFESAEVFALRRKNPQPTRPGHVHVALLINFDAVNGVFARCARHIEEDFAV